MKVCIVHDSEKSNGQKMAEKLAHEFEERGAQVETGHRTEIKPEHIAANPPDLLIIGAAVRAFVTSPPMKKWITQLVAELGNQKTQISHAAVFLTHMMPDAMVEGRVERLKRRLSQASGIGEVHSEWLSGQVENIPGPFVDGALDNAVSYAADLYDWARPDS